MEMIDKIKNKIKQEYPDLYDQIIENNLSDDEIIALAPSIYKMIEDKGKDTDHTVEIVFDNQGYNIIAKPISEEAVLKEKIQQVKNNYLIPLENDYDYLINLNDDIKQFN